MMVFRASQRSHDGRWDFTIRSDENCRAIGYCAGWDEEIGDVDLDLRAMIQGSIEKKRPFHHLYHTDGHATPEEARECYQSYLIDHGVTWRRQDDLQRRCNAPECSEWTHAYAEVAGRIYALCDAHRTRSILEQVIRVSESWES